MPTKCPKCLASLYYLDVETLSSAITHKLYPHDVLLDVSPIDHQIDTENFLCPHCHFTLTQDKDEALNLINPKRRNLLEPNTNHRTQS